MPYPGLQTGQFNAMPRADKKVIEAVFGAVPRAIYSKTAVFSRAWAKEISQIELTCFVSSLKIMLHPSKQHYVLLSTAVVGKKAQLLETTR